MTTACSKPPIPKNKPRIDISAKTMGSAQPMEKLITNHDEPLYHEIGGAEESGQKRVTSRTTSSPQSPDASVTQSRNGSKSMNENPRDAINKDDVLYSKVKKPKDKLKDDEKGSPSTNEGLEKPIRSVNKEPPAIRLPRSSILQIQEKAKTSGCPSPVKKQIHYFESLDVKPRTPSPPAGVQESRDNTADDSRKHSKNKYNMPDDAGSLVVENSLYDKYEGDPDGTNPDTCMFGNEIKRGNQGKKEETHVTTFEQRSTGHIRSKGEMLSRGNSLYAECLEENTLATVDERSMTDEKDTEDIPPYATSKKRDMSSLFTPKDQNDCSKTNGPSFGTSYSEDDEDLYAKCQEDSLTGLVDASIAKAICRENNSPKEDFPNVFGTNVPDEKGNGKPQAVASSYCEEDEDLYANCRVENLTGSIDVKYAEAKFHPDHSSRISENQNVTERRISHRKTKSLPSPKGAIQLHDPLYAECSDDNKSLTQNRHSGYQSNIENDQDESIPFYTTGAGHRPATLPRVVDSLCDEEAGSGKIHTGFQNEEARDSLSSNEDIPPYATSHAKVSKSGCDDENVYEDVDNDHNEVILSLGDKEDNTFKMDKNIYDYICMFDPDKVTNIKIRNENNKPEREILVCGTGTQETFEDFVKYYKDLKHKLYVEGFKADSITNLNILQDKIQSDFKCICFRPNSEDVEILCLKDDVHSIKEILKSRGDEVEFIYEMAKSTEIASFTEEDAKDKFQAIGFSLDNLQVFIHVADITSLKVGAIVNAANAQLANHGGVAKAIAEAAGPKFSKLCKEYVRTNGPIAVSQAVKMDSCNLVCKAVLHTVGPRWEKRRDANQESECLQQLEDTFRNIFKLAENEGIESLALPPVSSGVFGVPHDKVASALINVLIALPTMDRLKQVHIVDIKTGILESVSKRLSKSGMKKVSEEMLAQRIGDTVDKMVNTSHKKGIRYKVKAFFTKSH